MRGIKSDDVLAIVDFLYYREANVYQENLDSFLAIAEELQLKGLTGKSENDQRGNSDETGRKSPPKEPKSFPSIQKETNFSICQGGPNYSTTIQVWFRGP